MEKPEELSIEEIVRRKKEQRLREQEEQEALKVALQVQNEEKARAEKSEELGRQIAELQARKDSLDADLGAVKAFREEVRPVIEEFKEQRRTQREVAKTKKGEFIEEKIQSKPKRKTKDKTINNRAQMMSAPELSNSAAVREYGALRAKVDELRYKKRGGGVIEAEESLKSTIGETDSSRLENAAHRTSRDLEHKIEELKEQTPERIEQKREEAIKKCFQDIGPIDAPRLWGSRELRDLGGASIYGHDDSTERQLAQALRNNDEEIFKEAVFRLYSPEIEKRISIKEYPKDSSERKRMQERAGKLFRAVIESDVALMRQHMLGKDSHYIFTGVESARKERETAKAALPKLEELEEKYKDRLNDGVSINQANGSIGKHPGNPFSVFSNAWPVSEGTKMFKSELAAFNEKYTQKIAELNEESKKWFNKDKIKAVREELEALKLHIQEKERQVSVSEEQDRKLPLEDLKDVTGLIERLGLSKDRSIIYWGKDQPKTLASLLSNIKSKIEERMNTNPSEKNQEIARAYGELKIKYDKAQEEIKRLRIG